MYHKVAKRREKRAAHKKAKSVRSARRRTETISDLKSKRILYRIQQSERRWFWIDGLPTDGVAEREWIDRHSNLRIRSDSSSSPLDGDGIELKLDDSSPSLDVISVFDFERRLDSARKSVINSPVYPSLGLLGHCKEFAVTLCDWSAEGVLAIKYRSNLAVRSTKRRIGGMDIISGSGTK